MSTTQLGTAGGLFALLVFVHFIADWIFQTHSEAMQKHNNARIRAGHCLVYTTFFLPVMVFFLELTPFEMIVGVGVLFFSHFIEDTYVPVYLWAKCIRRVPVVRTRGREGFKEFAETPLGKILMIAVDQIIHLAFLWVLVWFAMNHDR